MTILECFLLLLIAQCVDFVCNGGNVVQLSMPYIKLCDFSIILLVDVEDEVDRGCSTTSAIPVLKPPLGFCLAESPALMGAMTTCRSQGSLCHFSILF